MNLNDLPEDILLCLLEWATFAKWNSDDDFSDNLRLLAVCQKWRALAKPIVYKCVFICLGISSAIVDVDSHNPHSIQEVANPRIDSNMELVQLSNSLNYIKCVELVVHYNANPLSFIAKAIDTLREVADVWNSARSLSIQFCPNGYLITADTISAMSFEPDIKQTGHLLVELFPNVQSAVFEGSINDKVSDSLCSIMSSHYSSQLLRLSSEFTMDPLKLQPFRKLHYLNLHIQNGMFQLPSVDAMTLVELRLYASTSRLGWTNLLDNEKSSAVTFSNLRIIDVEFDVLEDETNYSQSANAIGMLQLLKLKHFALTTNSSACSFLKDVSLPRSLGTLSINADRNVYEMLGQHNLKSIDELNAVIGLHSQEDAYEFYPSVNRLIDCASPTRSKLVVFGDSVKLDADQVEFANLHSLKIMIPIDLSVFMGIICNNPQLRILNITTLEVENAPESMALKDDCEQAVLVIDPLDSKLEHLEILIDFHYAPVSMVPVVKYLLAALLYLKSMTARKVPSKYIHAFIEQNKDAVPNLRNVVFSNVQQQ